MKFKTECFWCEKDFEYSDDETSEWQDLRYNNEGMTWWVTVTSVQCPHCKETTEISAY